MGVEDGHPSRKDVLKTCTELHKGRLCLRNLLCRAVAGVHTGVKQAGKGIIRNRNGHWSLKEKETF